VSWREEAAPIIARVIREVGTADPPALRKALREAYPWHPRRMWPYKVWLSEIQRQMEGAGLRPRKLPKPKPSPEGQLDLFSTH
jgi:hypothetical protein